MTHPTVYTATVLLLLYVTMLHDAKRSTMLLAREKIKTGGATAETNEAVCCSVEQWCGHQPQEEDKENTHSNVSPGILSLSRWAFMAELCSLALWCTCYIHTAQPQPHSHPPLSSTLH